jgi:hypothetical protein
MVGETIYWWTIAVQTNMKIPATFEQAKEAPLQFDAVQKELKDDISRATDLAVKIPWDHGFECNQKMALVAIIWDEEAFKDAGKMLKSISLTLTEVCA